jgi:hypothetical protein
MRPLARKNRRIVEEYEVFDSFTLAVVIGIGVVFVIFFGMILADKGPASDRTKASK